MNFLCPRCKYTTDKKYNYIRHLNRKPSKNFCKKNVENIEYKCKLCENIFDRRSYVNHINNRYSCNKINENKHDITVKKLEIKLEIEKQKTIRIVEVEKEKTKQKELQLLKKNSFDETYNIFNKSPKFIPINNVNFKDINIDVDDIIDLKDNNSDKIFNKVNTFIINNNLLFYICRDKSRINCSYVNEHYELINDHNLNYIRNKIFKEISKDLISKFKDLYKINSSNTINIIFAKRLKEQNSYIYNNIIECFAKSVHMDRTTFNKCKTNLKLYKSSILS